MSGTSDITQPSRKKKKILDQVEENSPSETLEQSLQRGSQTKKDDQDRLDKSLVEFLDELDKLDKAFEETWKNNERWSSHSLHLVSLFLEEWDKVDKVMEEMWKNNEPVPAVQAPTACTFDFLEEWDRVDKVMEDAWKNHEPVPAVKAPPARILPDFDLTRLDLEWGS